MKDTDIQMNPNLLVRHLQKPACEFTLEDIVRFVEDNNIEMLNFRYVGEDGRLKTLNFVINSKEHLINVLSSGERVDGSSLFSYVEANSSDLYVVPRYRTAFLNPFTEVPTLDILCSFYNNEGKPLESAPEYILKKAHDELKKATGFNMKALGELEYYVVGEKKLIYPAVDQKGYHASPPFTAYDHIRTEALQLIAQCGGKVKYGHSEVGNFSTDTNTFEQHEIEFLPMDIQDAADQLVIAKWILRMLGDDYGVDLSFAPKITVGKAGSGLHFHMLLEKDGKNIMADKNGLTETAKKMIAGILDLAKPITAFGNTIPTSYLRLVPHQEAPTNICWGDRNRSVLVRVPLGWTAGTGMVQDANPVQKTIPEVGGKQTVELRSADGSADIYGTLAALCLATQHGLTMKDSLKMAEKLYVNVNIFKDENKNTLDKLDKLPASCSESADSLLEKRAFFEKNGIFPAGYIDNLAKKLKSYNDKNMSEELFGKKEEIRKLVEKYFHCM
ncbi:MAG: glutamine synthetase [Bacteroidetes bacterium GWF2_38_335]|nr:MAG: glutamine synthetase [Bacteroidetes bacterium GWF2_38_335]OFY78186.1 MAG: glutamine synthetase [Bacteroidetes bacterium RIFOXYA12_FULL_38_20]HBS88651.1 glutamine synthetase [Bacteroidales bacterium]